jgi:hypothetical protein
MSEAPELSFATVLAERPPGRPYRCNDVFRGNAARGAYLCFPPTKLFCENEHCEDYTFWDPTGSVETAFSGWNDVGAHDFLTTYKCRHCKDAIKKFSLSIIRFEPSPFGDVLKVGEFPNYGPPTPARLISLIGPDKDLFLKGRRSETMSLGIAAFAYYRRVVENQKGRLFGEIIKVAEKVGEQEDLIAGLKTAAKEVQFTKAIDSLKPGLPQFLLMNGHNPLTLLHSALSEGLHAQSDEECLELAQSIRIVLAEMSERIATVLSQRSELNDAVAKLANKNSAKRGGRDEAKGTPPQ